MRRAAAQSSLAKVAEKLRSRQMATRRRASAAMASILVEDLEKLQDRGTSVQEWAKAPEARSVLALRSTRAALDRSAMPASNSTWAEMVEEVRTRQVALQGRAGELSSLPDAHGVLPRTTAERTRSKEQQAPEEDLGPLTSYRRQAARRATACKTLRCMSPRGVLSFSTSRVRQHPRIIQLFQRRCRRPTAN
jgi:hypothetical protein